MSKYRKYKNGIYGIRYNGHYIVFGTQESVDDCKWMIDISMATKEEKELVKKLYALEIIDLSIYYTQLLERKNERPLNPKERMMEKWLDPVRSRKADDKPLTEI